MNRTEKQATDRQPARGVRPLAARDPGGLPRPHRSGRHRVPAQGARSRARATAWSRTRWRCARVKGTPLEQLAAKFENTTGVAYTGADPVALAKVLVDFAKDHPSLVVKGGAGLGQQMLDADGRQGALDDAEPARAARASCSGC